MIVRVDAIVLEVPANPLAALGICFDGDKFAGERIEKLQGPVAADQLPAIARAQADHDKPAARLLRGDKPIDELEVAFAVLFSLDQQEWRWNRVWPRRQCARVNAADSGIGQEAQWVDVVAPALHVYDRWRKGEHPIHQMIEILGPVFLWRRRWQRTLVYIR